VLSALVHPWFYALLGYELTEGGLLARPGLVLGWPFWLMAWFDLLIGYLASWRSPLMPLYWLLISAAAYRALWQFMTARFK
jgi:glycosyltransferase XagB